MEIIKLILIILIGGGLSLFVAYKMVLLFSDENDKKYTRKGRAKSFFYNNMRKNEGERKLHNDQFNWAVFRTKMKMHLLPAVIAIGIVGFIGAEMIKKNTAPQQKPQIRETITEPENEKPFEIISIGEIEQQTKKGISLMTDERGRQVYTNTEPQKQPGRQGINSKETPVIIENNQILIPVVIGNKGKAVKTYFLLDTGCNGMLIHHTIADVINPDIISQGKATVADGRQVDTKFCTVDFIQVGPFTEYNLQATTNYVEEYGKHHGLLGMEFLKKHPFQIDHQRSVIKWI